MTILRKQSHLYAAITSVILALGEIILIAWAITTINQGWSYNPSEMGAGALAFFIISITITGIGALSSIGCGIWQLKEEHEKERKYAGWLSIFASYFFFTFFVNFTMWRRSGLTKKQFDDGVRKYNIEHFKKLLKVMHEKKTFPASLKLAFEELNELKNLKLLSEYEADSYMYKLIVAEVTLKQIPVIYSESEIFDLEVYK